MGKNVNNLWACFLAFATAPIFAKTVSSTAILVAPEKGDVRSIPRSPLEEENLSLSETLRIQNSFVKIPSLAITPVADRDSWFSSTINSAIDSLSPIAGNIQTKTIVSVNQIQTGSVKDSPAKIPLPQISRHSLLAETSDNFALVNPAPETTRIASVFGWRIRPFSGRLQMHNGIDYGAPLGSPVVAARDGIVTKVVSGCLDFRQRWCGSQFGNWIEIDHGNGMVATYAHLLHNSITVREGTKVWQNQKIAEVGSSGWSTGAHLDFRIKLNGEFQDPDRYVTSSK